MNTSRLVIGVSLLTLVSACGMTKEQWMPWTANKKGNPQEQVILGERRTPGQQATQPYTAYSGSGTSQPMPVTPQQNAGVMPPREMQQAPSQGWADQAEAAPAPQKKGLFSFFSKKNEPEAVATAPAPDMGERRVPMLNQQALGTSSAPLAPVTSGSGEEKPFPKLATVPDAPKAPVSSGAAGENIKQMEKARDDMAAELPPPPPPPGAPGMMPPPPPPPGVMPPPPPPPVQASSSGEKDYPVHRWAENPVPQTLEGGVITSQPAPAPMPASIQPQQSAAAPAPAQVSATTSDVKPQVKSARWADADTSGQVQKVEVPTSAEVVGVPPAPTPAEPIVLAPRSAVVGDQIPESRYAARRRAE